MGLVTFVWIDIYFESPNFLTANAGKQFIAKKFKPYIASRSIIISNALVKIHNFIDMVQYYHELLYHVCSIIIAEMPGIQPNLVSQMFLKAINNLIGPNKLFLTLLVFDAYFRIT